VLLLFFGSGLYMPGTWMDNMMLICFGTVLLLLVNGCSYASWLAYDRGVAAAQRGDWQKATSLLTQKLVDSPDRPDLLYDAGVASYRSNDIERAYAYFTKASEHGSAGLQLKEQAYFNIGNCCVQQNQLQKAVSAYENALEINPNNERAIHNLGIAKQMLEAQKQQEQRDKDNEHNKQGQQQDNNQKSEQSQRDQDKQSQDDQQQKQQQGSNQKGDNPPAQEQDRRQEDGEQRRDGEQSSDQSTNGCQKGVNDNEGQLDPSQDNNQKQNDKHKTEGAGQQQARTGDEGEPDNQKSDNER